MASLVTPVLGLGLTTSLLLLSACTTTEGRARVISRAGTVHDIALVPTLDAAPITVAVGADVFTDAELSDFQARLPGLLTASLADVVTTATTDPVGIKGILRQGQLQVVRIKVKAAAGRERHRTLAECRLRVKHGDDVFVDVEGTAIQLVQARNVSVIELDSITDEMVKNGGRNPLLAAEDTEAAVVAACSNALLALVDDSRPDDAVTDEVGGRGAARVARKDARLERLRRALDRYQAETARAPRRPDAIAAVLVDIGETGGVQDAPAVSAFLHDEHPLVRKASTLAFQNVCAGHRLLPADEDAVARCTPPPPPPPPTPPPPPASDAAADGTPPSATSRPIVDSADDSDDDNAEQDDTDVVTPPPPLAPADPAPAPEAGQAAPPAPPAPAPPAPAPAAAPAVDGGH